jgi:hypothetical protein
MLASIYEGSTSSSEKGEPAVRKAGVAIARSFFTSNRMSSLMAYAEDIVSGK